MILLRCYGATWMIIWQFQSSYCQYSDKILTITLTSTIILIPLSLPLLLSILQCCDGFCRTSNCLSFRSTQQRRWRKCSWQCSPCHGESPVITSPIHTHTNTYIKHLSTESPKIASPRHTHNHITLHSSTYQTSRSWHSRCADRPS